MAHHSAAAKGWQSERFCLFPQAIIFAFEHGQCRIQKIQILIHHFKIPSKLEFYIGRAAQDSSSPQNTDEEPDIQFKRLGYVDLQDNSENFYKVRELKSIHVDAEGTHLKIVLHKCFINSLNLYNQVPSSVLKLGWNNCNQFFGTNCGYGLHSQENDPDTRNTLRCKLNFFFELKLRPAVSRDEVMSGYVNNDAIDRRIEMIHDLDFDINHDQEMIRFMASVSKAKEVAVKSNYN